MPVSADVTSTRAPDTAWLSTPAILPITMSVVEPICATAIAGLLSDTTPSASKYDFTLILKTLVTVDVLRLYVWLAMNAA
jgi:hypothetical protein